MDHILKEKDVNPFIDKWKDILGLQDWTIKFTIRPKDHLTQPGQAEIFIQPVLKQALIYLVRKEDFLNEYFDNDQEAALVHELLHIIFNPFMPDEEKDETKFELWHQALNTMAVKLLALEREKSKAT